MISEKPRDPERVVGGPDSILDSFDHKKVKLRVYEPKPDLLVLEGSRETFRFLAAVLGAMADSNCEDWGIAPDGPGYGWYAEAPGNKALFLKHVDDAGG